MTKEQKYQKEYCRRWYQKNKKRKDAQGRVWRKKNAKRQKFLSRRSYLKNKEKVCRRSVENRRKRLKTPGGRKKQRAYNTKQWRKKNVRARAKAAKRVSQWRRKNPNRWKNMMLKHHYGITFEDFLTLKKSQGNRCAICRKIFRKTPHVDHDHKTRAVRGLLCATCNLGIGMLKDSSALLEAAAKYLRNAKCRK